MQIKKQFKGLIITRNTFLGQITFDPYRVTEDYYKTYRDSGFPDIFEEIEIKKTKPKLVKQKGTRSVF